MARTLRTGRPMGALQTSWSHRCARRRCLGAVGVLRGESRCAETPPRRRTARPAPSCAAPRDDERDTAADDAEQRQAKPPLPALLLLLGRLVEADAARPGRYRDVSRAACCGFLSSKICFVGSSRWSAARRRRGADSNALDDVLPEILVLDELLTTGWSGPTEPAFPAFFAPSCSPSLPSLNSLSENTRDLGPSIPRPAVHECGVEHVADLVDPDEIEVLAQRLGEVLEVRARCARRQHAPDARRAARPAPSPSGRRSAAPGRVSVISPVIADVVAHRPPA